MSRRVSTLHRAFSYAREQFVPLLCQNCLRVARPNQPFVKCRCGQVAYCSSLCKNQDYIRGHKRICTLATDLQRISRTLKVSRDLLFPLLCLMGQISQDNNTNRSATLGIPIPNEKIKFSITFRNDIHSAADIFKRNLINGLLTPPSDRDMRWIESCVDECERLVAVFKYFCHTGHNGVYYSVFPRLARFAHSCSPNCVLKIGSGKCEIRVVKDVSEGEELTISLLPDLYQSSKTRQKLLNVTRGIACTCTRCKVEAETGTEYLSAFCCPESGCQGLFNLPLETSSPDEALRWKPEHLNSTTDANNVRVGHKCTQGHDVVLEKGRVSKWVNGVLAEKIKDFIHRMQGVKSSTPEANREHAKKILQTTKTWGMHPSHRMLYVLYPMLAEACEKAEDFSQSAMFVQAAISCWEKILPGKYWPILSLYYDSLAELLKKRAETRITEYLDDERENIKKGRDLFMRLAREAEERSKENKRICFGSGKTD
mmetsp:Transcript_44208/g.71040  ORF Transcript_44208/g.71040 Transcript_44208/m.71040 type:complete len:484 (+) Transcript_44208:31-1482(+)